MWLSEKSGHGVSIMVSQWGSTIKSHECALSQVFVCLFLLFYVLATSKLISRWHRLGTHSDMTVDVSRMQNANKDKNTLDPISPMLVTKPALPSNTRTRSNGIDGSVHGYCFAWAQVNPSEMHPLGQRQWWLHPDVMYFVIKMFKPWSS